MENMKIGNKKYTLKKFNLKLYKMFMKAAENMQDEEMSSENIDILEDLIIMAYNNEFTRDDLEENFDLADLIEQFMEIVAEVQKKTESKMKGIENTIQAKFGNVSK